MTRELATTADDFLGRAMHDETFRADLEAGPQAVLASAFGSLADDIDIKVVQDCDDLLYLHIPAAPGEGEISDSDRTTAQGGAARWNPFENSPRSLRMLNDGL